MTHQDSVQTAQTDFCVLALVRAVHDGGHGLPAHGAVCGVLEYVLFYLPPCSPSVDSWGHSPYSVPLSLNDQVPTCAALVSMPRVFEEMAGPIAMRQAMPHAVQALQTRQKKTKNINHARLAATLVVAAKEVVCAVFSHDILAAHDRVPRKEHSRGP